MRETAGRAMAVPARRRNRRRGKLIASSSQTVADVVAGASCSCRGSARTNSTPVCATYKLRGVVGRGGESRHPWHGAASRSIRKAQLSVEYFNSVEKTTCLYARAQRRFGHLRSEAP